MGRKIESLGKNSRKYNLGQQYKESDLRVQAATFLKLIQVTTSTGPFVHLAIGGTRGGGGGVSYSIKFYTGRLRPYPLIY